MEDYNSTRFFILEILSHIFFEKDRAGNDEAWCSVCKRLKINREAFCQDESVSSSDLIIDFILCGGTYPDRPHSQAPQYRYPPREILNFALPVRGIVNEIFFSEDILECLESARLPFKLLKRVDNQYKTVEALALLIGLDIDFYKQAMSIEFQHDYEVLHHYLVVGHRLKLPRNWNEWISFASKLEANATKLLNDFMDPDFYRATYCIPLHFDPVEHYQLVGGRLGFWPTPVFDTLAFRYQTRDHKFLTDTPYEYFLLNGGDPKLGFSLVYGPRKIPLSDRVYKRTLTYPRFTEVKKDLLRSPLFSAEWINLDQRKARYSNRDLETDFFEQLNAGHVNPTPLFDTKLYCDHRLPDDPMAWVNPLYHYLQIGWSLGLPTSPYFSDDYYVSRVSAAHLENMAPLAHFASQEKYYPYDPSPDFSCQFYLEANPDVRDSDLNPLLHYLSSGKREGRATKPSLKPNKKSLVPSSGISTAMAKTAHFRWVKTGQFSAKDHVLILVCFCPTGKMSELQISLVNTYRSAGYKLFLICNTGDFSNLAAGYECSDSAEAILVRENVGFDFGAWQDALKLCTSVSKAKTITFTNDSVYILNSPTKKKFFEELSFSNISALRFVSQNHEIQPHGQSYLFCIPQTAIANGALAPLINAPLFTSKDQLIQELEIKLTDQYRSLGFDLEILSDRITGIDYSKNPTIHSWAMLVQAGFPIFKLQLLTSGIIDVNDAHYNNTLTESDHRLIDQHLEDRGIAVRPRIDLTEAPRATLSTESIMDTVGVRQSFVPAPGHSQPLLIPFEGQESDFKRTLSLVAVVHCFYLDIAETLLLQIRSNVNPDTLILTTDNKSKGVYLAKFCSKQNISAKVLICPNRGRDIGPFLIAAADDIRAHDLVLHMHTKKSLHDDRYKDWGQYLQGNLISDARAVKDILRLLQYTGTGLVYSHHFKEVIGLRNWGYDFEHARVLAEQMNRSLSSDQLLDFPTSTMFYARTEILAPLLALNLSYTDFEEEKGQIDGTLAHAIERLLILLSEWARLKSYPVLHQNQVSGHHAFKIDGKLLPKILPRLMPRLSGSLGDTTGYQSITSEIFEVPVRSTNTAKMRFNVLIPTLKPHKIYGGIASALSVARKIFEKLPKGMPIRLIVTSDDVDFSSMQEVSSRFARDFILLSPEEETQVDCVIDLSTNRNLPLSLRAKDIFMSTAWWTDAISERLVDRQKEIYSKIMRRLYLVQDYEPGFYPWSTRSALARSTYTPQSPTIGIVNSGELYDFIKGRGIFDDLYLLPYAINKKLMNRICNDSFRKTRSILIYGRPSVDRNLFDLIIAGIRAWQARTQERYLDYKILFAGETFDGDQIKGLHGAQNLNKLSLDQYADQLKTSGVGISLMESPHPSYPPLEMASTCTFVITNSYANKDMRKRSPYILQLDRLTPNNLAQALDDAVKKNEARLSRSLRYNPIKGVSENNSLVNYSKIANSLCSEGVSHDRCTEE